MKKNKVEFISAEYSVCLLTVFSFSIHPWCQLVSQSSSRQPIWGYKWSTVCSCLLQAWLVRTVLPCWLFISTRPRVLGLVHLMSDSTACTASTCLQRGPLVWSGGWDSWITSKEMLSSLQGRWRVFPVPTPHIFVYSRLFLLTCNFQWISCLFHVWDQSV